jgi:hypothetical protein
MDSLASLVGLLILTLILTPIAYLLFKLIDKFTYWIPPYVSKNGSVRRPWIAQHLTEEQWRKHRRSFSHYSRRVGKYTNFHGGTIGWLKCEGLPPITAEMAAELKAQEEAYQKWYKEEGQYLLCSFHPDSPNAQEIRERNERNRKIREEGSLDLVKQADRATTFSELFRVWKAVWNSDMEARKVVFEKILARATTYEELMQVYQWTTGGSTDEQRVVEKLKPPFRDKLNSTTTARDVMDLKPSTSSTFFSRIR